MFWKKKIVVLQFRHVMNEKGIESLEEDLSKKFKCKVIILPACLESEVKIM